MKLLSSWKDFCIVFCYEFWPIKFQFFCSFKFIENYLCFLDSSPARIKFHEGKLYFQRVFAFQFIDTFNLFLRLVIHVSCHKNKLNKRIIDMFCNQIVKSSESHLQIAIALILLFNDIIQVYFARWFIFIYDFTNSIKYKNCNSDLVWIFFHIFQSIQRWLKARV